VGTGLAVAVFATGVGEVKAEQQTRVKCLVAAAWVKGETPTTRLLSEDATVITV